MLSYVYYEDVFLEKQKYNHEYAISIIGIAVALWRIRRTKRIIAKNKPVMEEEELTITNEAATSVKNQCDSLFFILKLHLTPSSKKNQLQT